MTSVPQPPLSDEVLEQIWGLHRTRRSFLAWDELPPRHQMDVLQWEGPPTPLARRRITGPSDDPRYIALLIALYASQRAAETAAASRVFDDGQRVHRAIVELEATSLEIIDARTLHALTDRALLIKDPEAWRLLRAIRDHYGAAAIWIGRSTERDATTERATAEHRSRPSDARIGADMIVLFADCIGTAMHVRDEAIYEIDGDGNAHLLRPVDEPQPQRKPRACGVVRYLRRWLAHITIALPAALVAHPATELAGWAIGVNVTVPAVIPALAGLGIGLALARPVTRRLRTYRQVIAHVLELPDSHALLMARLDELQHTVGGGSTALRLSTAAAPVTDENIYGHRLKSMDQWRAEAGTPGGVGHARAAVRARTWLAHATIVLPIALVAQPALQLAGGFVGVKVSVPAVIPALAGLGIGLALARSVTRRLGTYRQVMAHVLKLPDSQALLIRRLDELQRAPGHVRRDRG